MKIYRAGVEIYDLVIDGQTKLSQKLMGEDLINLSVVVDQTLDLRVGDYTIYKGQTYEINRPVSFRKVSDVEYRYDVQFEGSFYRLLDKIVLLNGRSEFYLTGTLGDFVDLIIANLNTIDSGWAKGTVLATDWKNLPINGQNCKELLDVLAGQFVAEYKLEGKTLSVVERVESATALTFEVGKGKGLYELKRESVDSGNTVTRGYFFGSSRNLDYSYRDGEKRLVFVTVEGKKYLENTSEYSKIVEKNVVFEDIYPRFTGLVDAVSTDKKTITAANIDFDLNEQLIEGKKVKVVFLSGDLMGVEFEVSAFNDDTKQVTLIETGQDNGLVYPSVDFYPVIGDTFTFFDIAMPSSYVVNAETTLYDMAVKWMNYYSQLRVKYALTLDARYIRDQAINLNIGDVVRVIDTALAIDKEIRITALVESIDGSSISAEISNYRDERWENELQASLADTIQQLTEARSAANAANQSITNLNDFLSTYTPRFDQITGLPTDNDALKEYLERIGDSSYVDTESKIISGAVIWKEGLEYLSTDFAYKIFGVPLSAPATPPNDPVTLAAADPNLSRVDAFYLDSFGNFGVKTGTPAVNPVSPVLAANELLVATVLIGPGALEPSDIQVEQVYDDNAEWTTSISADAGNTTTSVTATDDPLKNLRHIKFGISVPDTEVSQPQHYIGEKYGGGRIFWLEPGSNGQKGLIAAEEDTAQLALWSKLNGYDPYATWGRDASIGAGQANTAAMLATPAAAGQAVKFVNDLIIGEYTDWFMPSERELYQMWYRRYQIGGMGTKTYWCSTERSWYQAYCIRFSDGTTHRRDKDNRYYVRAIRKFDDTLLPSTDPVEYYSPVATNVLLSAAGPFPITDGILSLNMKSTFPWRANSVLLIETYLDNVRTGSVAMSPATSLFGFKPENENYQLVALQMFNFVPTKTTFDAIKISLTGSWPNNIELLIDDIRFQYSNIASESKSGAVVQVSDLTLIAANWVSDSGTWRYDLLNTKIKDNSIVDVIPDILDLAIVRVAGIYPETVSEKGKVMLYAANQPGGDIRVTINITEATL